MNKTKTLVLGGIRSGKSAQAEQIADESGQTVIYLATAAAGDEEMARRIRLHQGRRPSTWGLVEEPLGLAQTLAAEGAKPEPPCVLIDCMSLWLSNLLHAGEVVFQRERQQFLAGLAVYPGPLVIVSNEVGLGIIGMDPLTRQFADQLGWLNQHLGARCDRVMMTLAGQVLMLKG